MSAEPHRAGPFRDDVRLRWRVIGDDTNVFGKPRERRVEVLADTEDEARSKALAIYPDMTITNIGTTGRTGIL